MKFYSYYFKSFEQKIYTLAIIKKTYKYKIHIHKSD